MTSPREDFRFFSKLRVRWVEVDMQKIVFNGHYLMYLDTAISDYWRALALPYEKSMHALGGDLFVVKSTLQYHGSALYDDLLDIGLKCTKVGNSSMVISGAIFRERTCLVSAELIYVFANPHTKKSMPIPSNVRDLLDHFEDGQAVTQSIWGPWHTLREQALPLRVEVFVQEQGVPLEMEQDDQDEISEHLVLSNALGHCVATARLLPSFNGVARLGRMAVDRQLRGRGLGTQLLQAMVQKAKLRGDLAILIHAQKSAQAFYAREGFQAQGTDFMEAGIEHIEMKLDLRS
jgi:YbgC/YbaW family acyl-CoA thioester hydrolase